MCKTTGRKTAGRKTIGRKPGGRKGAGRDSAARGAGVGRLPWAGRVGRLDGWIAVRLAAVRERSPRMNAFFGVFARFGPHLFFAYMGLLLLRGAWLSSTLANHSLAGVFVAVAAAFGSKFTIDPLAARIGRVRPFAALGLSSLVDKDASDPSFPSNHAGGAFALAVPLAAFFPHLAALTLALGFFVAFSRVYAGIHYLSDVAAGGAIGALAGFFAVLLYASLLG